MGERRLIKLVTNTSGSERFHIMGLRNITDSTNSNLYWYSAASGQMTNYSCITLDAFGAGKINTETMTKNYTLVEGISYSYGSPAVDYGPVGSRDLWLYVTNGWYVPSKKEWAAFAGELGVDTSNYGNYESGGKRFGLMNTYWTSTQANSIQSWELAFSSAQFGKANVAFNLNVRLGTTF